MRFADRDIHAGAHAVLPALLALASGCTVLGPPPPPAVSAPAPEVTAAKVEPPPAPEVPAVAPAVQRAFDAAREALAAKRFDEAERGFLVLAKEHPELGGPHANLAIVYRQAGKHAEAVAALERAVRASPQQPAYYNQLGIAYRHAGQFTKARDAYEQAIALDPRYPAAILNLGILYDIYLPDAAQALAMYERYLALSPSGDEEVGKWISDLKNRTARKSAANRKEQQ